MTNADLCRELRARALDEDHATFKIMLDAAERIEDQAESIDACLRHVAAQKEKCSYLDAENVGLCGQLTEMTQRRDNIAEILHEAEGQYAKLKQERDQLAAAIATPEVYADIVSDIVEKDFAAQILQLKQERDQLQERLRGTE